MTEDRSPTVFPAQPPRAAAPLRPSLKPRTAPFTFSPLAQGARPGACEASGAIGGSGSGAQGGSLDLSRLRPCARARAEAPKGSPRTAGAPAPLSTISSHHAIINHSRLVSHPALLALSTHPHTPLPPGRRWPPPPPQYGAFLPRRSLLSPCVPSTGRPLHLCWPDSRGANMSSSSIASR